MVDDLNRRFGDALHQAMRIRGNWLGTSGRRLSHRRLERRKGATRLVKEGEPLERGEPGGSTWLGLVGNPGPAKSFLFCFWIRALPSGSMYLVLGLVSMNQPSPSGSTQWKEIR